MLQPPTLTPDDIQQWLKATIHNQDPPLDICRKIPELADLLETATSDYAETYIATHWITNKIQAGYLKVRQSHNLNTITHQMDKRTLVSQLRQDFGQYNANLEAWSLLYTIYVHVDIAVSADDFRTITNQSQRTLRRRKATGYTLLCKFILDTTKQSRDR